MPGGLTRVAADETVRALSMQSGASSKDAWVLSEAPVDNFSLLGNQGRAVEIKRHGESAPSRAMDNLFWLGRYAERTESLVRILRAVTARLGDALSALDLTRKLLVPFSQDTDVPVPEGVIADEAALAARIADPDLWPPPEPRPATPVVAGGIHRLVGARPPVADTWRTIHALTERGRPAGRNAETAMRRARASISTRWCGAARRCRACPPRT